MIFGYLLVALVLFILLLKLKEYKKENKYLVDNILKIEYQNKMVLREIKKVFGIEHYKVRDIRNRVKKNIIKNKKW